MSVLSPVRTASREPFAGAHPWGSLDVRPSVPSAVRQLRLRVAEPGTSPQELRLLRAHHSWPVTGALVAVAVLVLGSLVVAPAIAALVALAVHVTGAIALGVATRQGREHERELVASVVVTQESLVTLGDPARLRATAARLCALDRARASGRLDEVGYLARWAEVWRALPER